MRLPSCLLAFTAFLPSLATATQNGYNMQELTQDFAETFIDTFFEIRRGTGQNTAYGNSTAAIEALFTPDFESYTGSVASLTGQEVPPLDVPFTQDRFSLASGQGGLSERSSKTDIFIFVVPAEATGGYVENGEMSIVWHWEYRGVGSGKQPIRGMNCFSLRWIEDEQTWKAFKLRFEFDSLAWSKNFG